MDDVAPHFQDPEASDERFVEDLFGVPCEVVAVALQGGASPSCELLGACFFESDDGKGGEREVVVPVNDQCLASETLGCEGEWSPGEFDAGGDVGSSEFFVDDVERPMASVVAGVSEGELESSNACLMDGFADGKDGVVGWCVEVEVGREPAECSEAAFAKARAALVYVATRF